MLTNRTGISAANSLDETSLLNHLRNTMRQNIQAQTYTDAIFFADKIMHLISPNRTTNNVGGGAREGPTSSGQNAAGSGDAPNAESRGNVSANGSGAHKVVSDKFAQAVYDLGYCYLLNKEYLRCVELLEKYDLVYQSLNFRVLAAQALFASGNITSCIKVLEKAPSPDEISQIQDRANASPSPLLPSPIAGSRQNCLCPSSTQSYSFQQGQRYLLLAKSFEIQENKEFAVRYYSQALKANCESFEAFNRLVANYLITQQEKEDLVKEMQFSQETLWLKDYYLSRIKSEIRQPSEAEGTVKLRVILDSNTSHLYLAADQDESGMTPPRFHAELLENDDVHDTLRAPRAMNSNTNVNLNVPLRKDQMTPIQGPSPLLRGQPMTGNVTASNIGVFSEVGVLEVLSQRNNFDLRHIEAEKYFNEQNYVKAHDIIKRILDDDFYYTSVVPLYCAVLTELKKVGELYYIAHKLVSANPDSAVAWFSVGSYYFLIKKYDLARKYFNKANRLDKHFAASWIAFGHAFAAQDESDQAMAAYRTAARLFPGCHQASLFIGMEYLRTNNHKIALMSFQESQKINSEDPLVYNEIGVVMYHQGKFDDAKDQLGLALSLCHETTNNSTTFETILLNLAHCHRKLKDLPAAIETYEKCLQINPKSSQTLLSLGYTYHLQFNLQQALHYYHKADFLKNNDSLIEELVSKAMEDINNTDMFPIESTYLASTTGKENY